MVIRDRPSGADALAQVCGGFHVGDGVVDFDVNCNCFDINSNFVFMFGVMLMSASRTALLQLTSTATSKLLCRPTLVPGGLVKLLQNSDEGAKAFTRILCRFLTGHPCNTTHPHAGEKWTFPWEDAKTCPRPAKTTEVSRRTRFSPDTQSQTGHSLSADFRFNLIRQNVIQEMVEQFCVLFETHVWPYQGLPDHFWFQMKEHHVSWFDESCLWVSENLYTGNHRCSYTFVVRAVESQSVLPVVGKLRGASVYFLCHFPPPPSSPQQLACARNFIVTYFWKTTPKHNKFSIWGIWCDVRAKNNKKIWWLDSLCSELQNHPKIKFVWCTSHLVTQDLGDFCPNFIFPKRLKKSKKQEESELWSCIVHFEIITFFCSRVKRMSCWPPSHVKCERFPSFVFLLALAVQSSSLGEASSFGQRYTTKMLHNRKKKLGIAS